MSRAPLFSILLLFSAPSGAHAICPSTPPTGTECVAYGAEKSITPAGQACRRIRNFDSTGQDVFVPVSSGSEWSLFLSYLPAGVTASACMICSPFGGQACGAIANGYCTQTCSGDGLSWGACSCACNPGYEMRNGACQLPMVCSPYSVQYCAAEANATCTQQCSADGMNWGGCGSCSCNPGYVRDAYGNCSLPYVWRVADYTQCGSGGGGSPVSPDGGGKGGGGGGSYTYGDVNTGDSCSSPGACNMNRFKGIHKCMQ